MKAINCPCQLPKPKFSLLEAPGVSVWRPKTHVFVVAGALPCSLCLFASRAFLHLCIPAISVSLHPGHLHTPGISESVSWASLHPGHLCISSSWASASWHLHIHRHLPIPGVEAVRQESRGAAPPAQLGCRRVSARAAESSSSQMLSLLSKSLTASFS